MIRERVRALLEDVAAGRATIDQALAHLDAAPVESLGFASIDHHRALRAGYPEVVFGEGKTVEQIMAICERLAAKGDGFLVTRAGTDERAALAAGFPGIRVNGLARTAHLAGVPPREQAAGKPVLVVTAGTSDLPVAEEAAETLAALGLSAGRLSDVGVAGIHRILSEHGALRDAAVVIVVAGMDGALPSVVGGLVRAPVIAVPTSVGYGASFQGLSALLAMLNSCAAGVTVCNIDNGFGAAMAAARIRRAVMGTFAVFLAGAVFAAVVGAWRARRRRKSPAALLAPGVAYERVGNRGTPGRGVRASLLNSVRDAADPNDATAAGESELADDLRGYLGDIGAQHGADDVMFWLRRDDGAEFLPIAWNHSSVPTGMAWGTVQQRAIVAWSAAQGVVSFDGDESAVSLASARVSLDSVATLGTTGTATGALVLYAPLGVRGPRGELKLWLPRHAERLTQIIEMQLTRTESTRQNRIIRALVRASQSFGEARTQPELEQMIIKDVVDASGGTFAALVAWDADVGTGTVRCATAFYPEPQPHTGDAVEANSTVGEVCVEGTQPHWTDAANMVGSRDPMFSQGTRFPKCGSLAILPIRRPKKIIGAIVIGANDPGSLRPGDLRSIAIYSLLAGAALESSWEIEEVKNTARIDPLTGLANRRAFDDELVRALDQTDRFGGGCALVLADVDHFKNVNDSHGHAAGDRVLKAIADVLRETVRTTDISARIGGEEFCMILQQTGAEGAVELAERLRTRIEALAIRWRDRDIKVTASFGIATYQAGGGQVKRGQLFDATDRALYRAKGEGRNCVRTA